MKKIINDLKRLIRKFTSRRIKLEERYTLNRKYLGRSEDLKIFIEKRQYHCDMLGIKFSVIEDDFPADQYGKVESIQNNKVIETAKLMKAKYNLIYWHFYE